MQIFSRNSWADTVSTHAKAGQQHDSHKEI
jgi:hypothetical protein